MNAVKNMDFGIGIAGGLSPDNVSLVLGSVLSGHHAWCNIDAEGKLRDEGENLNIEKAAEYVCLAFEYFINRC